MLHIIRPGPMKILPRRQMQIARHRLVDINQPKSCVKETDEKLFARREYYQPNDPKAEMKHIISSGPARQ